MHSGSVDHDVHDHGLQNGDGRRAAESVTKVIVAGRAGVPAGATGAVLSLAVVNTAAVGFLAIYPSDGPQPVTSTLNYGPGGALSNGSTVALDPSGEVCIFTSAETHLVVDVTAHVPAG